MKYFLYLMIFVNYLFANNSIDKEIKESIKSIIINGQNINKNDYPAGMPAGMLSDEKEIEEVSNYILNGLKSEKPLSYGICAGCHGSNGEGMSYVAPNLQFYSQRIAWELDAKRGNLESEYNLGVMYLHGEDVKQDLQKAFKYLSSSAKKEFIPAYINLGIIYSNGIGVTKDLQKAFKYYEMAANKGNPYGEYNLGNMYLEGRGVKQDCKKAVSYFNLASKQGFADAYINLGIMYEQGMGVKKNIKEAMNLYKKACEYKIQKGCDYYSELQSAGY